MSGKHGKRRRRGNWRNSRQRRRKRNGERGIATGLPGTDTTAAETVMDDESLPTTSEGAIAAGATAQTGIVTGIKAVIGPMAVIAKETGTATMRGAGNGVLTGRSIGRVEISIRINGA